MKAQAQPPEASVPLRITVLGTSAELTQLGSGGADEALGNGQSA